MAAVLFVLYLPVEGPESQSSVLSGVVRPKAVDAEEQLQKSKESTEVETVTEAGNVDESDSDRPTASTGKNTVLGQGQGDHQYHTESADGTASSANAGDIHDDDCVWLNSSDSATPLLTIPVGEDLSAPTEEKPVQVLSKEQGGPLPSTVTPTPSTVTPTPTPGPNSHLDEDNLAPGAGFEPGDSGDTDDKNLKLTNNSAKKGKKQVNFPHRPAGSVEERDIEQTRTRKRSEDGGGPRGRKYDTECVTLLEGLQNVLRYSGINKDVWTITKCRHPSFKTSEDTEWQQMFWQVSFILESKYSDRMLRALTRLGLGRIPETSLSVFPANLYYAGQSQSTSSHKPSLFSPVTGDENNFLGTVKSKLAVAEIVEKVKASAALTFDFVMFLLLASIIAGLGLAESSSVILVASMLVSPIMGPILGGTFGVVIKNEGLWKMGLKNEIFSLTLCLLWGFVFGLLTAVINCQGVMWDSTGQWPTPEMQARGLLRSLWVGVWVAIPSGAGVALSILSGNAGSLVGVAISASLLPPAVNAGMLWAYALVTAIHPPPLAPLTIETSTALPVENRSSLSETSSASAEPSDCPALDNNAYQFVYSCQMSQESMILGTVSLLLTFINIICIIVMGIVVLKIKEVTAVKDEEGFWKRDLQVARDLYKTLKGPDSVDLAKVAKQIAQQFREMQAQQGLLECDDSREDDDDPDNQDDGRDLPILDLAAEEFDEVMGSVTENRKFKALCSVAYKECREVARNLQPGPYRTVHLSTFCPVEKGESPTETPSDMVRKPVTAPVLGGREGTDDNPFFKVHKSPALGLNLTEAASKQGESGSHDVSKQLPLPPSGDQLQHSQMEEDGVGRQDVLKAADQSLTRKALKATSSNQKREPTTAVSMELVEATTPSNGHTMAMSEHLAPSSGESAAGAGNGRVEDPCEGDGDGKSRLEVSAGGMKKSESIGRFSITKVEQSGEEIADPTAVEMPQTPADPSSGIKVLDS